MSPDPRGAGADQLVDAGKPAARRGPAYLDDVRHGGRPRWQTTAVMWLAAVWATIGLWLQLQATAVGDAAGPSIVWVAVLAAFVCLALRAPWCRDTRVQAWAAGLAALFAAWSVLGAQLQADADLAPLADTVGHLFRTLAALTGLVTAYWLLLVVLLGVATGRDRAVSPGRSALLGPSWRSALISAGIVLACWAPFYIGQFPGRLITDSTNQVKQVLGMQLLTNHHPVIHTLMVGAGLKIGEALGSLSLGVALDTIGQMVLLAAAIAIALVFVARFGAPRWLRAAILAYFCLNPMMATHAVTVWKDTPHAAVTLLLATLLFTSIRDPRAFWHRRSRVVWFVVLAFLFCTLRNNGLWAFVLFVPVLLVVQRNSWRRIVAALAGVVVLLGCYNVLIYSVLGAKAGSTKEALSVPLQQIARTARDHGAQLTAGERAAIVQLFPNDDPGVTYNPRSSDPVKAAASWPALHSQPARFAGLWFELGVHYPGSYLTSFLANSYGYWYPDSSRQSINQNSVTYAHDHGVPFAEWAPTSGFFNKAPGAYLAFANATPLLSMFSSMGFMAWVIAFAAVVLVVKRRRELLLPFALVAALWLTVLASPLWGDFRYALGVTVCGPLFLAVAVTARAKRLDGPVR